MSQKTLEDARNSAKIFTGVNIENGRYAVIVCTRYNGKYDSYGIQFWTPEMIEKGFDKNTDGSISHFIEKVQ